MNGTAPPWVVKVGGDELLPGPALGQLVLWTARQVRRGNRVVLVHGGGDEVSARAAQLGLPTEKLDGQRVTPPEVLEVVAEVLAGRVNVRLTNALESAGVPAVGVTGVSGRMLPVRPAGRPSGALGWVGEPIGARVRLLGKLLEEGLTPVVAPLGTDETGGVYNVNADLAAGALAAALGGPLFLLTDVPALRGKDGRALADVSVAEARRLIADGTASDGMIPKLTAALSAAQAGAAPVWIGSLASLGDDGSRPRGGTVVGPVRRLSATPLLPARTRGAP